MPRRPLSEIPLLDERGVEIPLVGTRVMQVSEGAVCSDQPSRVGWRGDVVGRCASYVYVRFDQDRRTVALWPARVRIIAPEPARPM